MQPSFGQANNFGELVFASPSSISSQSSSSLLHPASDVLEGFSLDFLGLIGRKLPCENEASIAVTVALWASIPERNNDHSKLPFFDCLTNKAYKYLIHITTLFAFALNKLAN